MTHKYHFSKPCSYRLKFLEMTGYKVNWEKHASIFLLYPYPSQDQSKMKVHFAATFWDNFLIVFVSAFQKDDCI